MFIPCWCCYRRGLQARLGQGASIPPAEARPNGRIEASRSYGEEERMCVRAGKVVLVIRALVRKRVSRACAKR